MDEGLFVLLGLVVLAVPFAVVYLLVRVSSLGREVETLRNRMALLDQARQSYTKAAPQTRPEEPQAEAKPQPESIEPSPIEPAAAKPSVSQSQAAESSTLNLDLSLDSEEDKPKSQPKPQPSAFDRGINWLTDTVKSYFTEGNLIVRVGVIVLFFGVAFLLRYAAENSMLPIELRIAAVALGGIALLVTGWRLRLARETYALIMQGGGVGILYLTLFASLRLYELLPAGLVFGLLLVMVVLSALLAIWQDARSLAILAVSGGFLAPVLTSTGEGSHIALFSFYALLNAGIVFIAAFKQWRLLNLVGFVFTFVIASAWGVDRYHDADYLSCQIFLILFFIFYAIIGTLFAGGFRKVHGDKPLGYVDGSLVFGLPLVAFSLQAALVKDMEYGLAWSAFALGLFYLVLTRYLWQRMGDSMRLLLESYLALGVLFATLVIPFALDGEWIATAWALEGAAVAWVSIRQQRQLGTAFALVLQLIAGVAFLIEQQPAYDAPVIINSVYMSALFVAVAGLFSSYYLYRHFVVTENTAAWQSKASLPFLIWAVLWWLGSGIQEIHRVLGVTEDAASLVFFAVTAVGFRALAERLQWRPVYYSPHGLIGVMALFALYSVTDLPQPFAEGFAWAWPVTWLAVYGLLYRINQKAEQPLGLPWLHGLGLWSNVLIVSVFAHWLADGPDFVGNSFLGNAWVWACTVIPILAALVKILHGQFWPFRVPDNGYRTLAVLPLIPALMLATLMGSSLNGDVTPLPYIPFINPLDLMQVLVFIGLLRWWYQEQQSGELLARDPRLPVGVISLIGGLVFIWLNAVLLRSLHHYFSVSYSLESMFNSALVQACLSVFWTLLGLALMVWSSRRKMRYTWLVAAGLIAVVVLKLFVIDLADSETLEAIISFIVVGALLLVIGYVSPIPPRQDDDAMAGASK